MQQRAQIHAADRLAAGCVAVPVDSGELLGHRFGSPGMIVAEARGEPSLHGGRKDGPSAFAPHQPGTLLPGLARRHVSRRRHKGEAGEARGVPRGEGLAGHPTEREAGDMGARQIEVVEQRGGIVGKIGDLERCGARVRTAMAARIVTHATIFGGKFADDGVPHPMRSAERIGEDDRRCAAGPGDRVEAHARFGST